MFEPEVLLLLLHECVGPLDHSHVTRLILNRMHYAHWHTINFGQIDRSRVHLTGCPLLQANWLLELASKPDLGEIHHTSHSLTVFAIMVDTNLIQSNELVSLLIIAVKRNSHEMTGGKADKSVDFVHITVMIRRKRVENLCSSL